MADEESPLVKALPPASDYLTYLTIVEYNLTTASLPILHKVLQDETLTTNIGWDLVHILVPLLPESEQCLQDIARLGNPREVILKVTESLRLVDYGSATEDDDEEAVAPGAVDVRDQAHAESSTYPVKTKPAEQAQEGSESTQMVEVQPPLPLAVNQCTALLSMLAILHPRIKTKYPTRFLSTTLQAVLATFSNASTHREVILMAIVQLVKTVMGIKRPMLPARKSAGILPTITREISRTADDPEGAADSKSDAGELAMQARLLQSFVTHVTEEYLLNLIDEGDVPGMAWCSRMMEKLQPERIVDNSTSFTRRFSQEDRLHQRNDNVGQLVTLAQDLKLTDQALLSAAMTVEELPALGHEEDDPPISAEDIPLSRLGSLLLYTAKQVSTIFYDRPTLTPQMNIFPAHREVLKKCLASPGHGTGFLGNEPQALIDAVLALGLICLEENEIGEPDSDEQFNEYLQVTALLSSSCPSPNLRGHAHYLSSTILRSQPDDSVRLAFIRDTLEHCPFENLKVSAVGWIKGETIEANGPTAVPGHEHDQSGAADHETSIFATPLALESLGPYLFPSLHADLVTSPVREAWVTFQTNVSFYLASLNFIYLLLHAKQLHQRLDVRELWTNVDIAGSFLQPLRDANARFKKGMDRGGDLAGEKSDTVLAELNLLDETIKRVTKAVPLLNA